MELSPRLALVARLIPPGSRVCDVGTDHGRLPVYLLERGMCVSAIATDLNPEPLACSRRTAELAGVSGISFRLADGLDGVAPHEVDTVVMAGMGGETIAGIIERAPWLCAPGYHLILQPQSKVPDLMAALAHGGYCVQNQHLAEDAGKLYTVLEVTAGQMASPIGGAQYVHESLLTRGDPLLESYLNGICNKFSRALQGLEQADGNTKKCADFTRALADLNRWRGEIES